MRSAHQPVDLLCGCRHKAGEIGSMVGVWKVVEGNEVAPAKPQFLTVLT